MKTRTGVVYLTNIVNNSGKKHNVLYFLFWEYYLFLQLFATVNKKSTPYKKECFIIGYFLVV